VGGRPGFKQYVFYGDDLSNHVQYVAKHGPHGAYLPIASEAAQRQPTNPGAAAQCREWVSALNDGGYQYAVIGPDQRTQSAFPVEAGWTAIAGGQKVEENDKIFVFRLPGALNPNGCGHLGPIAYGSSQGVSAIGAGSGSPK
jgi:hypothetical protein